MDEELVEVRKATHPPNSEGSRRWPGSNGRDEILERCLLQPEPSSLGEPTPRTRYDQSRRGDEVVFTKDEMRRDVTRGPRIKECRSLWAKLDQQVAELASLDGVKEQLSHASRS